MTDEDRGAFFVLCIFIVFGFGFATVAYTNNIKTECITKGMELKYDAEQIQKICKF